MYMKKLFVVLLVAICAMVPMRRLAAQDLQMFQLKNGLTVYIWEDSTMTDVYGEVAVRIGSVDDPEAYTGLAHYLEHVMFKGTAKIGTLDWEREKPIYEEIVSLYDQMAAATSDEERQELSRQINEQSVKESKFMVANEYAYLIEGLGGSSLNAGTSYDMTVYFNRFPANQISKWLMVASERFIQPVFRSFQSELETVYEEYNLYQDNKQSRTQEFMLSKLFEGTPYERPVIGLGEHLKNPRLSQLIKFYEDWYVPENMALILVGNIQAKTILRPINATFGKLPAKSSPAHEAIVDQSISGRKQYTSKLSDSPSVLLAYNAPARGSDDEIAMELCLKLLSNSFGTGLLDRMSISGDVMGAGAEALQLGTLGRVVLIAVPYYDQAQRTYDSSKKVEKLLSEAAGKMARGEFDPAQVDAIKLGLCRDYDLSMESDGAKSSQIRDAFIYGLDLNKVLSYKDRIAAVTVDDIKRVAAQYFNGNVTVIYNEIGKPGKTEKIVKPSYDPITPVKGLHSAYASSIEGMFVPPIAETYADWSDVSEKKINSYSTIYYAQNEKNDVFTLILKYGANRKDLPFLQYGSSLMNSAGIMAYAKSDKLREEFASLGATYEISADDDYLYVTLRGYEQNLQPACLLLTRLLLMPDLDEKQLGNVIGSAATTRMIRKKNVDALGNALQEYMLYGDQSEYLSEPSDEEIIGMDISKLTGSVIEATHFAAEIHYSGQLPFDQVYPILASNLPLVEGEKPTTSPIVRDMKKYDENTIYFFPSTEFQQAQILFYVPMDNFEKDERVAMQAFNEYIGGGFNGLILQEIREYNSMAYTATGGVKTTRIPGKPKGFTGYVGTQNDKALDAIALYMKLLTDMPVHHENLQNIKNYLLQNYLTRQDARDLSSFIADWKRQGYDDTPAKTAVPRIKELTYEDIFGYYEKNIKGKPIVIGIIGNPRDIPSKELAKFGKVITVSEKNLFRQDGKLF